MPPNNQFPAPAPVVAPTTSSPVPQAPLGAPQPAVSGSSVPQGSGNAAPAPAKPKNPNSTQNSLLLSEVRDNMVIMTDGSFRAVVACQSINFDLMSSREREGVEYSYQNFINALNHPIQILIKSQRIDLGPYIDHLVEMRQDQDNMLLNVLMDDYITFIDSLSQDANIMSKTFFITIPYYPTGDVANLLEQGKGFFGKIFAKPKNTITRIDKATYEKAKTEIKNRVDAVMSGLFQLGIQSQQLDTKALGELYYNFYNPDTAVLEPLANFNDVTTTYVQKAPDDTPFGQPGVAP